MKTLLISAAAAAAALLAPAAALADDLSGSWKVTTNAGGMDLVINCNFVQKDKALGGTCGLADASDKPAPLTGTLTGQSASWSYDVTVNDMPLHVAFSGTVEGSTISGSMNAMGNASKFEAVKQ